VKLLHISDLHLGKRLNEFPLVEDQIHILNEILRIAEAERPDAILAAGDIYDKSIPPAEAILAFDDFVYRLHMLGIPLFAISGNHDSAERLSFGARMMQMAGVFISRAYDGTLAPYRLTDEFGAVDIYLLPFVKPSHVRRFFPDAAMESYTDAVRTALSAVALDPAARHILVAHQFVTGAAISESEEVNVGGLDNVDASVFDGFDYVALGHLHSPQAVGRETLRYCGTPLKYSFSEINQTKSVTVIQLGDKGNTTVSTIPLMPLREMQSIRGTYMELLAPSFYRGTSLMDDYLHITLTDEHDVPEAMGKLRAVYRNLMKLSYDNTRTRAEAVLQPERVTKQQTPAEVFAAFYEQQNNQPLSGEQAALVKALAEGGGTE